MDEEDRMSKRIKQRSTPEWGLETEVAEALEVEGTVEPGESPERSSTRSYVQAPEAVDPGVPCPHCGERYGHTVSRTYNQGQRRMKCASCGKPFPARRLGA
jgi:DNA-directed RNA polymerase subunit RPC12/RpoP